MYRTAHTEQAVVSSFFAVGQVFQGTRFTAKLSSIPGLSRPWEWPGLQNGDVLATDLFVSTPTQFSVFCLLHNIYAANEVHRRVRSRTHYARFKAPHTRYKQQDIWDRIHLVVLLTWRKSIWMGRLWRDHDYCDRLQRKNGIEGAHLWFRYKRVDNLSS